MKEKFIEFIKESMVVNEEGLALTPHGEGYKEGYGDAFSDMLDFIKSLDER